MTTQNHYNLYNNRAIAKLYFMTISPINAINMVRNNYFDS